MSSGFSKLAQMLCWLIGGLTLINSQGRVGHVGSIGIETILGETCFWFKLELVEPNVHSFNAGGSIYICLSIIYPIRELVEGQLQWGGIENDELQFAINPSIHRFMLANSIAYRETFGNSEEGDLVTLTIL
jgi:hypothetical protein